MAVRGSRGAQRTRTDAERARLYAARKQWHDRQRLRRRRDTVIAVVAGALIVVGAIVSQTVHAQLTAPEPAPTVTPSAPATPAPTPGTPAPTSSTPPAAESPSPTQTPGE